MNNKYSKKYLIETGKGLQDVDGIENSEYFNEQSSRYINNEISFEELNKNITSYYEQKSVNSGRSEEADKVSLKIASIISEDSFTFTVGQYLAIHKYLFDDIFQNAGKLREYNFSKKEWVLNGASVTYGDYRGLEATLVFDFNVEKNFNYSKLTIDEIIKHLSIFVSNLWQIHAFEEGNTRTTAVFFIKYLRSLGFNVTNDTFAKNSWYFRNSLVRANYFDIQKGIFEDRSFLIKFLRNLLLKEKNVLSNRDLHIDQSKISSFSAKRKRILELISKNPKIKTDELADKLGVSLRTIKYEIESLKKDKLVERISGNRYGYWKVNV